MPVLSFEPGAHHPDGLLVEQSIACSKPSDSGERCEVKIAMKSRGGLGRAFIFSRSFFLRTAPHYLNAWNRLNKVQVEDQPQQKSPHYTRQAIFTRDMMHLPLLLKSADPLWSLLSLPETNNGRSAVWVRWKRHNFLLFSYIFLWYSSCSCNLLCLECNKIARWVKPLSSRTQNNNKFFSSWKSAERLLGFLVWFLVKSLFRW